MSKLRESDSATSRPRCQQPLAFTPNSPHDASHRSGAKIAAASEWHDPREPHSGRPQQSSFFFAPADSRNRGNASRPVWRWSALSRTYGAVLPQTETLHPSKEAPTLDRLHKLDTPAPLADVTAGILLIILR